MAAPEQVESKEAPAAAAADTGVALHASGGKAFDPFEPPYNKNLFVGELKEERFGEDYVVLVHRLFSLLRPHCLKFSL